MIIVGLPLILILASVIAPIYHVRRAAILWRTMQTTYGCPSTWPQEKAVSDSSPFIRSNLLLTITNIMIQGCNRSIGSLQVSFRANSACSL